jgi:transcriptional regulator with XRE-family HTH domain
MEQRELNMDQVRLGARLRACRTAAGVSRQALATRLQLSERRIGAFERGAAAISALELRDLAAALQGSVVALLTPASNAVATNIPPSAIELLAASDEGADLAEAFTRLKTARLRKHLVGLAQELVQQERQA